MGHLEKGHFIPNQTLFSKYEHRKNCNYSISRSAEKGHICYQALLHMSWPDCSYAQPDRFVFISHRHQLQRKYAFFYPFSCLPDFDDPLFAGEKYTKKCGSDYRMVTKQPCMFLMMGQKSNNLSLRSPRKWIRFRSISAELSCVERCHILYFLLNNIWQELISLMSCLHLASFLFIVIIPERGY